MSVKTLLCIIALFVCCSQVAAEITIKRNFFTGWKYSTDGKSFTGVGFSGTGLYNDMAGNAEAQKHMKSYKTDHVWGLVTALPGGFLIGWPLGSAMGGGEWTDTYTTMIIVGIPISIASMVFDAMATSNLKKAVKIYNVGTGNKSVSFMLDYKQFGSSRSGTMLLGAKLNF